MERENRKIASGEKLKQIEQFLKEKFKSYYLLITVYNYLTLKQFINLSINIEAKELFKAIMYELKTLMSSMKIKFMRPVPLSFDSMINFMGYITQKGQIMRRFHKMKEVDEVEAFYLIDELNALDPSVHSLKKIQNKQEANRLRREQLELINMVKDKYVDRKGSTVTIKRDFDKSKDIREIQRFKMEENYSKNYKMKMNNASNGEKYAEIREIEEAENSDNKGEQFTENFDPVEFKKSYFEKMKKLGQKEDSLEDNTEDIQSMV